MRRHYDRTASGYDSKIVLAERLLFGDGRAWAASQGRGRVLEVGVGTGRNLPYYAAGLDLVALDLSRRMLEVAGTRVLPGARRVRLVQGDAACLPFVDCSFDTVIATLALCSIPEDRKAVTEMARVLAPGGKLVLLEHVESPNPAVRAVQRMLEPLFLMIEKDHLLRSPEPNVDAAGLVVEQAARCKLGIVLRLLATKPAASA